jgi:hypothetical protein
MVPDILYTIILFFENYRIFWIVLSEVSMLYEVIYLGNLRWSLLAYAESRASLSQKSDDGSYNSERDHLSRVSSAYRWVRPYRR